MERESGGQEDRPADINLLTKGDWGHLIQSGLPLPVSYSGGDKAGRQ